MSLRWRNEEEEGVLTGASMLLMEDETAVMRELGDLKLRGGVAKMEGK